MMRFALLSVISFVTCFMIGYVFTVDVVPWNRNEIYFLLITACVAALTLPLLVGLFVQLCGGRYVKRRSSRTIIGFLLGSGLGVVTAGLQAVFHNHELAQYNTNRFMNLLSGAFLGPSLVQEARNLYFQAKVLSSLKLFVEYLIPFTLGFGVVSVIILELNHSRRTKVQN